jgi:tetratricopeptide (TPR) repeat protein
MGLTDQAREAFTRLVTVNPASVRGHLALGAIALSPGPGRPPRLEEAQRHFEAAHALNREETGSMIRMGEIALVRGDEARARRWLQSALRTNPRCVEAAFLLGYLDWSRGDREGAKSRCLEALDAAAVQAPVKGVAGEGDRRGAAPSPASPAGRTLFSALSEVVRPASGALRAGDAVCDPGAIYPPVRDLARRLGRPAPVR